MAFEPKSGDHAIIEVVFGLRFAEQFQTPNLERVQSAHDEWRMLFPRVSRGAGVQFQFGDGALGAGFPLPLSSLSFDQMRPDGSFKWRLRFEGNMIWLNCLEYDRWTPVWKTVAPYLSKAAWIVAGKTNPVIASILQYVDVFEWKAPKDQYNAAELLKKGAAVPSAILDKGSFWHLHQGWFRSETRLPHNSRLLERVHFDAVEDEKGQPTVRLDTYLEHQLDFPVPIIETDDPSHQPYAPWFPILHDLDKELLRSVLTKKVAKRIGLND